MGSGLLALQCRGDGRAQGMLLGPRMRNGGEGARGHRILARIGQARGKCRGWRQRAIARRLGRHDSLVVATKISIRTHFNRSAKVTSTITCVDKNETSAERLAEQALSKNIYGQIEKYDAYVHRPRQGKEIFTKFRYM